MDVNGVIGLGAASPAGSSVTRTPAPVSRAPTEEARVAQSARDVVNTQNEEQAQPANDILEAKRAASTRSGTRLRIDEATHQVVAQIVNADNEVIKQIPPEELLRIAARFRRVVGVIFDQKV